MCNRNHLVHRRGSAHGTSGRCPFHITKFFPGRSCWAHESYSVLRTYDGDTKYQLGNFYVMQPPQFVPMVMAPVQASQPLFQQPAASALTPGQQAQDAVMMASAMWQMMSSMVQQQQRIGSVPGGPGTPRMGCPPAAVTPVLPPRIAGINATPRFPAPSQMTNVPIRTPLTPPVMRSTPQTGTQGYVHLQHQDVQPSQRTPDCDPSPVDHCVRPSSPWIHRD